MSDREPVDFVVGGAEPPPEVPDDLVIEPRRPDPRLRWTLAGAAVVLAGIALVAGRAGGHHAAATPSASSTPTVLVFVPPPDVVGLTPRARVPEGNRTTRPPADCPTDAQCHEDDRAVPDGAVSALDARFPAARLTSVSSLLANRAGRFEPDLVRRTLHLRAGSTDIAVSIRKPERGDATSYALTRTARLARTRLVHVGAAFTVTVVVTQDGSTPPPSRRTLTSVATDERLVAPR